MRLLAGQRRCAGECARGQGDLPGNRYGFGCCSYADRETVGRADRAVDLDVGCIGSCPDGVVNDWRGWDRAASRIGGH